MRIKSEVEILRAARAKIADERHWTTGVLARDRVGKSVIPTSEKACSFCALGALAAVGEGIMGFYEFAQVEDHLYETSSRCFGNEGVAWVNDNLGHEAVLKVYDATIREVEGG